MKNLARSTLLMACIALSASSCTSSSEGQFVVHWTMTLNGASATCSQVRATSVQVWFTPTTGGVGTFYSAPCGAGSLTTDFLLARDYWVDVDLVDASGNVIDTISPTAAFSLFNGEIHDIGTFQFDFTSFTGQGYFKLSWTLTGASGRPISCAAATAATLQLTTTDLTTAAVDIYLYACTMGTAVTDPTAPDVYQVKVDLLDASSRMLNTFTPTTHYAIYDGYITNLGTYEFNFSNVP